jgi:alkyl hydroperoxide reductase subunit F
MENNNTASQLHKQIHKSDILILGGGPAGAAAAIYVARKGLNVSVIAKDAGGSVYQTPWIENLITIKKITGAALAAELISNMEFYGAHVYSDREVTNVKFEPRMKIITTTAGEEFQAPQLIIATGSKPKNLNVRGEKEYEGKGVAHCPHCEGPHFKKKRTVVAGGGNAGIETAIELARICSEVIIIEYQKALTADEILINHAKTLPNISIMTNSMITRINGDGTKVTSVTIKEREHGNEKLINTDGIFIQIGMHPNSELFEGLLSINGKMEIASDQEGRTSETGVYVAGDVSDNPFKQIVTAIGAGATAALSACNDKMRAT